MILLKKTNDKKITNNDDEYKEENSKLQDLNEIVDDSKTTDNLRSDKYELSHNNQDNFIEKVKGMKNTNDDDEYKEDTSKH